LAKRSRKRAGNPGAAVKQPTSTRAERDAARRARAERMRKGLPEPAGERRRSTRPRLDERPPPPWAPIPITELLVLVGLVLMAWGFLGGGGEANARIGAGLAIASLAGLELAVREHVTGFRSHTTLLSSVAAVATIILLALVGLRILGPLLIAGALVFGGAFYALRELFKRRSGGVAFR
jgi:hypothetical protein